MEPDRFKTPIIATLAKRAANSCSNPECGATTSGPADAADQSVNVGVAAHIYGARAGSARHDPAMASAERGDITNAIWLCQNCHKLVDDDPDHFPAGLLFEWKRGHERQTAQSLGKAGARARERYLARHLGDFEGLSYLAEEIIIEKPRFWEHKLTSEILRTKAGPIFKRWDALKKGLYSKPLTLVPLSEVMHWLQARHREMSLTMHATDNLMNGEFQAAWSGTDGEASDVEIVRICTLFAEACASILAWEETVRFVKLPNAFDEVQELYIGIQGMQLDELAKMPAHLAEVVAADTPGIHRLSLTFDFPEGWVERHSDSLERAVAEAFD